MPILLGFPPSIPPSGLIIPGMNKPNNKKLYLGHLGVQQQQNSFKNEDEVDKRSITLRRLAEWYRNNP
jgi:hypothetical protein